MTIRTKRAGDSVAAKTQEVVQSYQDAVDSGSVAQAVIDFGLAIAEEKVSNGLRAAGLGLDDGTVSAESIRAALSARIGADIPELSPEGIQQALNASISYQIGRAVGLDGFDLQALLQGGSLEDWARGVALELVASGRPSRLVPASALRALKDAAALEALGMDSATRAAARNRARQKKHRESYKQVWV
jgi:hypothetical protein